jgi:hypothetical protein
VGAFRNPDEALLLAGRLRAEGIEARIHPDVPSTVYGRETGAMFGQPTEVLVPEEDAEAARRVIEEIGRSA